MENVVRKELSLPGMFYRMREDWIRYVIRLPKAEMSATEKVIAVYIAQTMNPRDRTWIVSQDRIAKDLDVQIRVVKSAVAYLKGEGLIRVRRVKVPGHSKLFNAYEIVAVELAEPI